MLLVLGATEAVVVVGTAEEIVLIGCAPDLAELATIIAVLGVTS